MDYKSINSELSAWNTSRLLADEKPEYTRATTVITADEYDKILDKTRICRTVSAVKGVTKEVAKEVVKEVTLDLFIKGLLKVFIGL